ncbi:response regulator transcription factor [Methyloversatilis thermotolerans]|uniref:response regulator transcription factor n=1 Tax=Methyloversatilis thermotolerans TaxID=1346290 RepID=UPI00039EC203|nr:response regulator transcription factor [Methyloversatilis thermotolerans]
MIHCVLVDDDAQLRESVGGYLRDFAMRVTVLADGRRLLALLERERVDVVLLDCMLPGEDGFNLCRALRSSFAVPVIMLSARGDPVSRVLGLELGADDYITKPFDPRELVARIHARVRRVRHGTGSALDAVEQHVRFAGWTFDRMRRELRSPAGVQVSLSAAEFRLLSAFVERPGRVLSREQLLELTRAPGIDVSDRSIDLSVSRLRQKLGDAARDGGLIRTVRGEGYLFDGAGGA